MPGQQNWPLVLATELATGLGSRIGYMPGAAELATVLGNHKPKQQTRAWAAELGTRQGSRIGHVPGAADLATSLGSRIGHKPRQQN